MISPDQLHALLEKIEQGVVDVDLLRIGQYHAQQQLNSNKAKFSRFRVALDMEQCLDRFYGGYYSDWACGGQWNRALQFVQLLSSAFNAAQIEVIAFFDGSLRENKRLQQERNDYRQKALSVLKHIRIIGTPPPKVWWLPPSGIRTTLRNALRNVNIQVVQTVHDHTMEIIDYFRENKLNAIIGLHPDYIVANISRYFNAHDMRLSYKGALETKEFMVSKLMGNLKLTTDQLAIVAVLLGGYVLIEDTVLREIYKKIKVEYNSDFETRIRKLAEVVRDKKTIDEFITTSSLEDFAVELRESIEYYQRRGAFSGKHYLGNKKKAILAENGKKAAPMASETCDTDEVAKKILETATEEEKEEKIVPETPPSSSSASKKSVKFVYTLPAEVIRTAAQRHQRGIMDPRIYIILIKKEILLPQLLEDEQYREIPAVHLFYRPARQMIYAILFNLYHQQYMHSKGGPDLDACPEVVINEWIWSPKNEYKTPEKVAAIKLNWAVPTVQRLWFGMTYEDKQRRMKAFLTILRSDTPLMLNRSYVPQHLLVLACVLRYIVANPERNIISRVELDAFLATAFSPQLVNVDYTQEMVLPSVHLRGVYLASLFMQGVETAQLANDACGVPIPWSMTNPWLFFDGKIFHLKLKMAQFVTNLRELCDDQIDIMIKVERFRKAILEDIEHLLLPTESLFRSQFYNQSPAAMQYAKNLPLTDLLYGNGFGAAASQQYPQYLFDNNKQSAVAAAATRDYQLKVGGVVVGSWAVNRGMTRNNVAAAARFPLNRQKLPRGRAIAANPNSCAQGGSRSSNNKNKNKNKSQKNKEKKKTSQTNTEPKVLKIQTKDDDDATKNNKNDDVDKRDKEADVNDVTDEIKNLTINSEPVQNGEPKKEILKNNRQNDDDTAVTSDASDLHESVIKICDDVLKDDDPIIIIEDTSFEQQTTDTTTPEESQNAASTKNSKGNNKKNKKGKQAKETSETKTD